MDIFKKNGEKMKENLQKEVQTLKESIKTYAITSGKSINKIAFELATMVDNLESDEEIKTFCENFQKLLNRDTKKPQKNTLIKLRKYYEYLNPYDVLAFEREVLGDEYFNSFFKNSH